MHSPLDISVINHISQLILRWERRMVSLQRRGYIAPCTQTYSDHYLYYPENCTSCICSS
jgi:hypothetical protein